MSTRKSKVFALTLGETLTTTGSIVTAMVFARILTKVDLATYRQTMLAYELVTPLLTLGIPSAIYFFLAGAKKRQRGIILDNMLLLTIMGCVFSTFLLLGGTDLLAKRFNNPALTETLRWLIPYPLYTLPAMGLVAVLIISDRVKLATVYNVISNFSLTFMILAGCWLTNSYKVSLLIKVAFPALTLPILVYLVFSTVKGEWDRPRLDSMLEQLKFGIPLGLATMLGSLCMQLDKFIVSSMCTPEQFAVYSNGAVEIPLIGMVTGAISTVILADMRKYCADGDNKEALNLFRKAGAKSAILLLPAMCFLFVFAESFIKILYSSKYIDSVLPFRIFLLILPIRILHYGSAFMALGKSKEIMWRSVGDLVFNAVLSIVFVKIFGPYGAALATVVTIYLWTVPFNLIRLGKGFETRPLLIIPFKQMANILIIAIVSAGIALPILLLNLPALLEFSFGAVTYSIGYVSMAFWFIPDFKDVIQTFKFRSM